MSRSERALLMAAQGVILAVAALAFVAMRYPYQVSYVEGFLVEQAARLAHGGTLYRPLGEPAWSVDNFPPLYPLLLSLVGPGFSVGRGLTVLAALGLMVLARTWHLRSGASPAVALALAALWIASPLVLRRIIMVRMDFAAILAAALGLWLYLRLSERGAKHAPVVAAGLFLSALSLRQTMLAAPLALVVTLLLHDRRRDVAVLLATMAALGGAVLLSMQIATDGEFLRHTVTYNTGRYFPLHYLIRLGSAAGLQWMIVLLSLLGLRPLWRTRDFGSRLLVAWLVSAFLFTGTAGKAGSTSNHFLEWTFVAGLVSFAGVQRLTAVVGRLRADKPHPSAAVLLLVVLVAHVAFAAATPTVGAVVERLDRRDEDALLVDRLADLPGPLLSENAGAVLLSGHDVLLEPRTLKELHLAGHWDDAPLVAAIENETYSVIVLQTFRPQNLCETGCRWTDDAWHAIQTHYAHNETIGQWQMWRPLDA